jgi:hypothetical protein
LEFENFFCILGLGNWYNVVNGKDLRVVTDSAVIGKVVPKSGIVTSNNVDQTGFLRDAPLFENKSHSSLNVFLEAQKGVLLNKRPAVFDMAILAINRQTVRSGAILVKVERVPVAVAFGTQLGSRFCLASSRPRLF